MVNTFWVSRNPQDTARILDSKRLFKQVVEAVQILNALQDIRYLSEYYRIEYLIENIAIIRKRYREDNFYLRSEKYSEESSRVDKEGYREEDASYRISKAGYWSHPATLLWFYHPDALKKYCNLCREEHLRRGGKTSIPAYHLPQEIGWPYWTKSKELIRTHQQSLLRKHPDHYTRYFREVGDFDDYLWLNDIDGWSVDLSEFPPSSSHH